MAAIIAAILVGVGSSVGAVVRSPTYTVRGTVYDLETGLRLGEYRYVPEITKPTCEGRYEVRYAQGNLLEEGLAVKIVEPAKLAVGEEVTITVRNLLGQVVLATSTRSGPPQEGFFEGDFQLALLQGSYWMTLEKEGYEPKTIALIVPWKGSELKVYLSPRVPYRELSPTLPRGQVVH